MAWLRRTPDNPPRTLVQLLPERGLRRALGLIPGPDGTRGLDVGVVQTRTDAATSTQREVFSAWRVRSQYCARFDCGARPCCTCMSMVIGEV